MPSQGALDLPVGRGKDPVGALGVGQQRHDQLPGTRIICVWSVEQIIQITHPSEQTPPSPLLVFLPFPLAYLTFNYRFQYFHSLNGQEWSDAWRH